MSSATTEITAENLEATIDKGIVVLDWWASWCGPCRMFAPVFEAAATRHTDVVWGKVNTESQPELAAQFEIQSIPTLMVFRDGILLYAQPGAVPGSALDQLIEQVRALDMDDVRKRLAERQEQPEADTAI